MSIVDRSSPTPLYEQIKHILREQILNGDLPPGARLPSEYELCEVYDVSRITVIRALNDLASEGLISRIQGKGTIVERKMVDSSLDEVAGFSKIVRRQGNTPSSRILSIEVKEPSVMLRQFFNLPLDASNRFMHFRRLLSIDGKPAAVLTSIVTEEIGQKMRQYELEDASFYNLFEKITSRRIVRNETILRPISATPEIGRLLHVEPGTAHFHFRGLSVLEDEIPIELGIGVYSGNVFEWKATIYEVRKERKPPDYRDVSVPGFELFTDELIGPSG